MLEDIIEDFIKDCDKIYGMYLDCTQALKILVKNRIEAHGAMPDDNLELQYIYAEEHDSLQPIQHSVTYSDFLARNSELGDNPTLLAQSCIVLIYGYWEDHYRPMIAKILNLNNKSEVKINIMGQLGLMRNEIVHHKGIVGKENSKRFSFHAIEGAKIEFTDGEFFLLIGTIKNELRQFRNDQLTLSKK